MRRSVGAGFTWFRVPHPAQKLRKEGWICLWLPSNTPHEGGGLGMKHPSNRAERRHERQRIINHRRFIRVNGSVSWSREMMEQEQEWSRYAKWNGNCGSMRCHYLKYFGYKRKRREALKKFE